MDIQFKIKVTSWLKFIPFFKRKWAQLVLKKASDKIHEKAKDLVVERYVLKGKILRMVRKYTNAYGNSEYIKNKRKNNEMIRQRVLAEFGDQMQTSKLMLTQELILQDG